MNRAVKGILLLAIAMSLSAGCAGSCSDSPGKTASGDIQASTVVPTEKLAQAVKASQEGLEETKALVEKAPSLNQDLADEAKVFESQEILIAIPLELETEKAKQQIRDALKSVGLEALRVQIEYHEVREKKGLPRYFPGPPPYPFTGEELEEVIRIHVDLKPSEPAEIISAIKALASSTPRLLQPQSISKRDTFTRIPLDIFRFRQISPPTQSYSPPSREMLLKAQGFPAEGPDCEKEARCEMLLQELDKAFETLEPLRPKAELSLRLEGELDMWKARRAIFDKHVTEIQNISHKDLLPQD